MFRRNKKEKESTISTEQKITGKAEVLFGDETATENAKQDDEGQTAEEQEPSKEEVRRSNVKTLVKDIAIACAIALAISLLIKPTIVRETSMEPTVEPSDYILVSRQAYRFGEIKRGDIIVFRSELKLDETHNKLLIKRVIALPGEKLTIKDGNVYINDEKQNEAYIAEGGTPGEIIDLVVPEGQVFVMGDHREVSRDSRELGCIDEDTIVGKAFFRLYPFSEIGRIGNE